MGLHRIPAKKHPYGALAEATPFPATQKICIHNRFELALFNYLTSFKLGSEKHKEWEYLQPAKKHIENKYDL